MRHLRLLTIFWLCIATISHANQDYARGNTLYQHGNGQVAHFAQALEAFHTAANANHADAQFYLGRMHQLGHGTPIDLTQAAHWYQTAGKQGEARAWNNLGNIYTNKQFSDYSPTKGIKCYQKASDLGMAMGSNNLGQIYHFGKYNTPRDFALAETFYQLALQQYPNYPGTWNNLGRLYKQGGHGIERDLEAARKAYVKAAHSKDAHGYYNLANLYYHEHLEASPDVIIRLYESAAKLGHVQAHSQLGWIYNTGRYGTVDNERAKKHFEYAAERGHANAQNSLAALLVDTNQAAQDDPRVVKLYAAAAKQDNIHAMNNYGRQIVEGNAQGVPLKEGVALLKKAAERDYPDAINKLAELSTRPNFQHYFSPKELKRWASNKKTVKQQARARAKNILVAARPIHEQGNYEAAIALVEAEYHKVRSTDIDRFEMARAFWWAAQTQEGRNDPEWGWRLFSWLKGIYDRDYPNNTNRLLITANIANSLIECGRMSQMRQVCEDAANMIQSMHGLSIDPPTDIELSADYTFPVSAYTTQYSSEMVSPIINHHDFEAGDWILRSPMESSLTCAREHLTRGNWKNVFFITGQVEHWAHSVFESGTMPNHTHRNWMLSNLSEALLIQAEAYELLGLHPQALDCYQSIIEQDMHSYGGRDINEAITRHARLLTQLKRAPEINLTALQATIQDRHDNKFENRDAYQFTELAYAHALHSLDQHSEAWTLINQLLKSTQDSNYTQLRIEALRVQIECSLAEGRTVGIETALLEILDLARSKGLNNLEPNLYELYAQYLALTEQFNAAQRIQQKAIDRLERLHMQARIQLALTTLQTLGRQNNSTRQLFDLQPTRITTAPLPNQGSTAVFSLSNFNDAECDFQLSLDGEAIEIVISNNSTSVHPEFTVINQPHPLIFHLQSAKPHISGRSQTHGTLSANEQQLIQIHAPASVFEQGDKQLNIEATINGETQQVELILQADAGAANIAIIDAIELIDNPYYLVPAFHTIATHDHTPETVGLRAIASSPTRIEAYNSKNELLFIDAEGNGDFNDPGDRIHCSISDELSPTIQTTHSTQIEFRYQPHAQHNKRVEVEVQTRTNHPDASWHTEVIDWIQPTSTH